MPNSLKSMRAAVYTAPQRLEIHTLPRPHIGPGELLVRTWGVGLCGTDLNKIWHGTATPGTVLGHELAGWVAEVGENVTGFQEGDRVVVTHHVPCYTCHYCLRGNYSMCSTFKTSGFDPGGFAEYVRLSERHVRHTTFRLPDEVSFTEAVFVEPLSCCLRGLARAGVRQDDVVWIIGAGSIGLLLAGAALARHAKVVISDLLDERLALARAMGVGFTVNPRKEKVGDLIQMVSDGRGADTVIPTVLTPGLVKEAIASLRDGGTLLLFAGTPNMAEVPLNLYQLWRREINLVSSYSPDPVSLNDAYSLIVQRVVRVEGIVSHQMPLEEIGKGIELAANGKALKVIIRLAEEGL